MLIFYVFLAKDSGFRFLVLMFPPRTCVQIQCDVVGGS